MTFFHTDKDKYEQWACERKYREENLMLSGTKGHPHKESLLLRPCLTLLSALIKLPIIKNFSYQSTINIKLTEMIFSFPRKELPEVFNNYNILHLSDLHLDIMPGLTDAIEQLDVNLNCDLIVFTGDFKDSTKPDYCPIRGSFSKLMALIKSKDGILAVPGNHDSHLLPDFLSDFGIKTLINETVPIIRNGKKIHVTGVDDVYSFYSKSADNALKSHLTGFKMILVHSPDFIRQASLQNFHLYLTGHTHGGQICLPGEIPVLTRGVPAAYIKGPWQYSSLRGYTSRGLGCSTVPLRLFSRGEITKITLRSL